jgi:inner membrane protein
VAPDLDGLGMVPELLTRNSTHPLLWFSLYHHSLHTLAFALPVAAIAAVLARQNWKVAFLALASFHLHLIEDLAGSRGPDGYPWTIPYLVPFSAAMQWAWQGQRGRNARQKPAHYGRVVARNFVACLVARVFARGDDFF